MITFRHRCFYVALLLFAVVDSGATAFSPKAHLERSALAGADSSTQTTELVVNIQKKRRRRRRRPTSKLHASSTTLGDETEVTISPLEAVPTDMASAISRFFLGTDRGPRYVVAMLAVVAGWRIALGFPQAIAAGVGGASPINSADTTAFLSAVVFWCFQEYFLHEKVLHSQMDWAGKEIHQGHHDLPYFHISIDPAPLMVGWLGVSGLVFKAVLPSLPLALSATLGYATAGLFYEWSHYIVHTRVAPPNTFWKTVKENHMRHHCVDSRYWYSFSFPWMDDWFGTNPPIDEVKKEKMKMAAARRNRNKKSTTRKPLK